MLSQEDKGRIRQEEIFRQEVQSDLRNRAESAGLWARILKTFNQPITLWILSAIVATAWTNYLSEQADARKAARERAALAGKIKQELVLTRLDTVLAMGENLRCIDQHLTRVQKLLNPLTYESSWDEIAQPVMAALQARSDFSALHSMWNDGRPKARSHPEFQGYSDAALRLQLETLTGGEQAPSLDILTAVSAMRSVDVPFAKIEALGQEFDGEGALRLADLRRQVSVLVNTHDAFLSYAGSISSYAGRKSAGRLNQILHGARATLCLRPLTWPD